MLAITMRVRVYMESLFSYQVKKPKMIDSSVSCSLLGDEGSLIMVVVPIGTVLVVGTSRLPDWTSSSIISSI